VRDHNGQVLAHVYFEDESGRRLAAKLLTKDEARRIACQYRQAAGAFAKGYQTGHTYGPVKVQWKTGGTAVENLLFEAKFP